ncbi:MAG TPA: phosphocarrier protein HPr, partial [Erysipelotrichaceae bacterium]|nr:phosphocarrier protein HPr [Erysipelotrichaceae bacterium]
MSRSAKVIITNPVGLYAAPAETLVDFVKQFNSDVSLTYAGRT